MRITFSFDLIGFLVVAIILLALIAALIWFFYRKAKQQAISRWKASIEDLPLGGVLLDRSGKIVYTNSNAAALLSHIDQAKLAAIYSAGIKGTRQSTILNGSEGLVVQAQSLPLKDQGGALIFLNDITRQQQAVSGYRNFIYGISHELLTPLTAVQGHLAHLQTANPSDENGWRGSLRVVGDEIERLTRLTSNMLLLSRLEAGQPVQRRPTNLAAVAEEAVLQLMEKADQRRATLNINAEAGLPRPILDRDAWKQVLLNLIDNAIKYGREGGEVDVNLAQAAGAIRITVQDDGPGIAQEDLPHIFTEMYRGDATRHVNGSGLGLAIVRRIVEGSGGTIKCDSKLGTGTTFTVTLPVEANVTGL